MKTRNDRGATLLVALAHMCLVLPLLGQEPRAPRLDRAGTLMRVEAPTESPEPHVGVFSGLDDGRLMLRLVAGAEVIIPRSSIVGLKVSTGRRGHPWWGVVVGSFAAGIPGAIWWSRECEGSCRVPGLEGFALGALYYGVLPGFIVGSLIRTRRWDVLPLAFLDEAAGRRGGDDRRPGSGPSFAVGPGAGGGWEVSVRWGLSSRR